LFDQWASGHHVLTGNSHGFADCTSEARAEVELWRKFLDVHAETGQRTPNRRIADKSNLIPSIPQSQCRANQRLEVTASATGRHNQVLHGAHGSKSRGGSLSRERAIFAASGHRGCANRQGLCLFLRLASGSASRTGTMLAELHTIEEDLQVLTFVPDVRGAVQALTSALRLSS